MSGSHPRFEAVREPLLIAPTTCQAVREAEGQCDCAGGACVPAASMTVTYDQARALDQDLQLVEDIIEFDVTETYKAIHSPSACGPVVMHRSALPALRFFASPHPLSETLPVSPAWHQNQINEFLDGLLRTGFLQPAAAPYRLVEDTASLVAWLHLTDRCNLRCTYCYLPHTSADMPLETGRNAIEATFRSALFHGYSSIKLKYAGGEPLLRFPLVTRLHGHARTLASRHGITLDGIVLSNGTLLTAHMVEMMQSLGLRLMISLDGIGEYHDCHRHFPDGQSSFDSVARAVDLALSYDLVPDISITISGRNVDGLPELIQWVLERDLPFSFNFYRENSLSESNADLRLEEQRIITAMLAAYEIIEGNLPRRSLLASLADRANLSTSHQHTCGAGQNYLVFDPLGRVAKCQMDMGHTVSDAHAFDPLANVRESDVGIHNLAVDEKDGCQECPWRYWCAGGCPLVTYRSTGRYDTRSPNCNIYRALYPEVLRLEGLRLLKYANHHE